ncbi:MAG: ATPase, T2SS/T4P/T4SS family [Candidatus Nanoarchaeia archaeon]|nr:ATPase, T2SS/T4P/T4SS family [Candidatus Nanoarchaeia archaeon]MDD5741303.1 ATPase, T2SS/T4P/T4SS family [Candidatus Nanoarchaeia archaeon]
MQRIEINLNPTIPALPKMEDKTKINVRYVLISPYVSVHIYWDQRVGELLYNIEEPVLSDNEKSLLVVLERSLEEMINVNILVEKTKEAMIDYIDKTSRLLIEELALTVGEESYKKIFYYLFRNFVGLNEIEPLMRDFFIEDIECNGINTPIFIVHRLYRNMKTNIKFDSMDKISSFVEKIAQRCGKYISYASPILDGSLPDGSRVNATYTVDVTSRGPTFTIRKFTKVPWTPIQLLSMKTISPEMLAYFWILLEHKSNILISGGTASGKTTLLNAIAFFIPPESRVVSIEDSVTGDSKIIIKENEKIRNITIKEFVDNKIDAEVMTLNENGKIIFVKPYSHIKHTVKKDIYEILTRTGRKVKVTQDHSLFSLGENGLIEIKPTELKEGESFIAVPRALPIEGQNIKEINLMSYLEYFEGDFLAGKPIKKIFEKYKLKDFKVEKEKYRWWKEHDIIKIEDFKKIRENFSYDELKELRIKSKNTSSIPVIFNVSNNFLEFCGLWLGDGSYDNYNGNSVILSNIDEECRNVLKNVAEYLKAGYSEMNDGGVSLRIHSTIFYKFMKNVLRFDGCSNSKKIPDFIFGLSNEQVKHFIRGYFSADGCAKKSEVSCASQSINILETLQTLLLRFGIISRINDFDRKDKCINMSISDSANISKFTDIGFLQERKNEKVIEMLRKKSWHTHSDIVPLSINQLKDVNTNKILSWPYLQGMQNIGRDYLQKIAIPGSLFNDLSHSDIFWDRVKKINKIEPKETEVFDLSIPDHEKFIVDNIFVHNTREINLPRENWLPSVSRTSLGLGNFGEVDLFSLLKNSFRQNPDYVIVGEVRGKEAFVLFQGMASGHSSISTMHADSVDTLVKRLETPPIELSPTLLNTLDCVAVMTHAIVNKQQTRRLREIVEIINVDPKGIALTNTPFVWNAREDVFYFKKDSKVFEKIAERYGLTLEELGKEFEFRTKLLYEMQKRRIFDFNQNQKIFNEYHKDPVAVLKAFGIPFETESAPPEYENPAYEQAY